MQAQIIENAPTKPARKAKGKPGGHKPKGVIPPELAPTVWKPGQTGNPNGLQGIYGRVMALARERSPRAVAKLCELIESPDDRVALMAADKLLERAWGKSKEIQDDKDKPAMDLSKLRPADLQALRDIAGRMRATPVPSQDGPVSPPEAPPSEVGDIPVPDLGD